MSALNLLYVGRVPPHPGGSAVVAAQLLAGLAARRHRVRVLAPITHEGLAGGDAFARQHPALRIERYLVPYFATAREQTYADAAYQRAEGECLAVALPRLVGEEPPDLIVAGQESVAWHVPALARRLGVPSVALVHGGTTFAALLEADDRPAAGERLIEELAKADRVVTVARHLADTLARRGLPAACTVPNVVDLQRFYPGPPDPGLRARLALGPRDVIVAQVSKLKAYKRPLDTVAAAVLARERHPGLVWVVVGDGSARPAVEAACRAHGIEDRFRFAGWVDYAEVPGYLRLADMVVTPSEHEGCSLVLLESQACGRTVLASDIPASREVIRDGQTGLLFRRGDVAELAARVLDVAADPALRQRIGAAARRDAEGRHVDVAVAQYEALFREVAGQPARP